MRTTLSLTSKRSPVVGTTSFVAGGLHLVTGQLNPHIPPHVMPPEACTQNNTRIHNQNLQSVKTYTFLSLDFSHSEKLYLHAYTCTVEPLYSGHSWQQSLCTHIIKCNSKILSVVEEVECALIHTEQQTHPVPHLGLSGGVGLALLREGVAVLCPQDGMEGPGVRLSPLPNGALSILPRQRVHFRLAAGNDSKCKLFLARAKMSEIQYL